MTDSGQDKNPYKEMMETQQFWKRAQQMTEGSIGPGSYVDRRTILIDWERLELALSGAALSASVLSFWGLPPTQAVTTGLGASFLVDGIYHRYRGGSEAADD